MTRENGSRDDAISVPSHGLRSTPCRGGRSRCETRAQALDFFPFLRPRAGPAGVLGGPVLDCSARRQTMPSNASLFSKPSSRPSLLARAGQGASAAETETSGFGLSILSAAREDHRPDVAARSGQGGFHGKRRYQHGLWLLGTGVVALALIGLSQWQPQATSAVSAGPQAGAPLTQAPAVTPRLVAQSVSQQPDAAASAPAAITPPAEAASAVVEATPGAALRALPVARPTAPAKPSKPLAKDPDAELVAAVMAHSDLARRPPAPKPLSDVQRFQFAMELKRCKGLPNQTTQDACVVAACESKAYWGRTRSCPLPPEPRPQRAGTGAAGSVKQG